jgi:hypothetical protein
MHNIMQMAKFIENQSKKSPEKFADGVKSASPCQCHSHLSGKR